MFVEIAKGDKSPAELSSLASKNSTIRPERAVERRCYKHVPPSEGGQHSHVLCAAGDAGSDVLRSIAMTSDL